VRCSTSSIKKEDSSMEHIKCKISRRKEIIKMRAKINEIETNTKTQ
jgi:hypothetical protein